ncbi:MOSC domain-containing protein [Vibrio gallicus]|uniref:MOSC domain-containing protein n=1 Tax=Vibrio gallicus TaxID=190897 RepID=UPI0021C30AD0|nr:MOSC domain-containing protein [Vibrio gallicus]
MKYQAQLSEINIYPIKSTAGISQSRVFVEKQGISFDRRFVVTDLQGRMLTARKHPKMVTIEACLLADGLLLSAPNHPSLKLCYQDFAMQEFECKIWSDRFDAYTTTEKANQWFSAVIGCEAVLLYCGKESNRYREKIETNVSFADGYPLLVISQGSLDELNRRASAPQTMSQFRTNLVVDGVAPFAEDSWKRLRIGEVEFEVKKPCQRCVMTTVNPEDGERMLNKEPTITLAKFRADQKGAVYFGMNIVALNEGVIKAGDKIEILETQQPVEYVEVE